MLHTVILKNNYQDSINLMLLTNKINALDGVTMSQIMMGTDANKDILNNTNLLTDEANSASANDMMIVVDSEKENIMEEVMPAIYQQRELVKKHKQRLLGQKRLIFYQRRM